MPKLPKLPYVYLNKGNEPLFGSKLFQALEQAQKRAPVPHWVSFIKGLTTKGVKESEIKDSGVLEYLEAMDMGGGLEKERVLDWLKSAVPTVKEINLDKLKYQGHSQPRNEGDIYQELLYVLNTERDNIDDRLEEIRFDLEELDFNMELLAQDPLLAHRLYEEQQSLLGQRKKYTTGERWHWDGVKDPTTGKHVANVLAHSRISLRDDLYFVEEIQSDWAQRGRRAAARYQLDKLHAIAALSPEQHKAIINHLRANRGKFNDEYKSLLLQSISETSEQEKNKILADYAEIALSAPPWTNGIPAGPWVTSTELWAGLILRRQIQRAALMPQINRLAWITGSMSNGGGFQYENHLDPFYLKMLPKIADKILSGTGEKTHFMEINFGNIRTVNVPGITITDKVREKMSQMQPLYSRDVLPEHINKYALAHNDHAAFNRMLQKTHEMLGSGVSVRLARQLFDDAMQPVAARITDRLIEVSINASNPARALAHEGWHYAYDHLLADDDKKAVNRAFADGTKLNTNVRIALIQQGANPEALAQCDDPVEAAAHGWSLWLEGKLPLNAKEAIAQEHTQDLRHVSKVESTVAKVFHKVERAFVGMGKWLRRTLGETPAQKAQSRTEDVFAALRMGLLKEGVDISWRNKSNNAQDQEDASDEENETSQMFRPSQRMTACG